MPVKLTNLDLNFILTQIEMAEAGQTPVNPLLAFGLREVDGTNNNLTEGGSKFGASFQPFPAVTAPVFQNAQSGTSYSQTSGLVIDSQPRVISQLIASQGIKITGAGADGVKGTADDVVQANPAALAAQAQDLGALGAAIRTPRYLDRTAFTAPRTTPARPFPARMVFSATRMTSPRKATWQRRLPPPTAVRRSQAWPRACSSPT
jgi:hypothetical protein